MSYTSVALITLIAYKLLLLGIGLWASRQTQNQEDFILAGRGLGPVVAALSYSASASSAWTLLGFSGIAYVMGVSAIWIGTGSVLGAIVAWAWVAPRLRQRALSQGHLTLTDFLAEGIEGKWRRAIVYLASLIILFSFAFYVAAQFQGAGNTFSSAFELPSTQALLLGAAVIMLYTLLGGFWAVAVTDAVQGALMFAVALLLPALALLEVGGLSGLANGLNSASLDWGAGNAGLMFIGFLFGSLATGLGTFGQPHLLNRFMALRDDKALRQARWMSWGWYIVVFGGMFLLGLCGHVLFPVIDNAESIFFVASESLLPTVLAAIVLAAVLSAIMSTADSQLLVAAATLSNDLGIGKHVGQNGGHSALLVSRLSIVGLTLVAVCLAIYLPASIFSRVLFAWSALGAAFGPLVFARLLNISVQPSLAFFAILIGFSASVFWYLQPNAVGDIAERLLPFVLGALVIAGGTQLSQMRR